MSSEEEKGETAEAPAGSTFRAWTAAILGWMIPGGGHLYLGKKGRAAVYFAVVIFMFAMGLALEGKIYSPERGSLLGLFAFLAEVGIGAPFLVLRLLSNATGTVTAATFEHGTTFLITAGLMNLLASLDAHDIALGRKP